MEKNVNYTIVGAFLALVLVAFSAFVIWLTGAYDQRQATRYTVYFEKGVAGISKGSTVKYMGVDVGEVTGVRLEQMASNRIKLDIRVDKRVPVRADTKATLKPQGITGQSYIALSKTKADSAPPKRMNGERYPVIQGSDSRLNKFLDKMPEIADRLNSITGKLQKVLSNRNIQAFANTLDHLEGVSDTLDGRTGTTLNYMNTTLSAFRKASNKAGRFIDKSGRTVDSLRDDLSGLEAVVKNAGSLTQRLDRLTADNEASIDHFLGTGLATATDMLGKADAAAENVNTLSHKLAEDPSRLIFGMEYKGLKIPKK